jgi:integrase
MSATARGRAARGTGVVEQRSTGWFVRRSEIVDGRRRRWFDGPFETKRDALRSSPVLASHRQTVDAGEWITDWARMRAEQLRSRDRYSAAKIVERHVRLHLAPHLSGIKLGELRPSHVSAIAEALNSTGRMHRAGAALGAGGRLATRYPSSGRNARTLSPKTIRNILSTLSSAMKTAVNDDLLRSNPVRDAEILARPRDEGVEELVVFDTVQADALADWCLQNLETETWALPVLVGLDCGLRRGEILAVKSTMIDEQTNRLKVNTGITEEGGVLVDKRLKTKRSRRTVVIPDRTIAAVKRYRQHHGVTPINGLLFSGRNGGLANPDTFTQAVARYLRPQLADMLGELPWTPHTLRHTFATRLLSQNVAPQTVSGLLGHESTAFTLARYSHWVDSDPPLLTSQVTSALRA